MASEMEFMTPVLTKGKIGDKHKFKFTETPNISSGMFADVEEEEKSTIETIQDGKSSIYNFFAKSSEIKKKAADRKKQKSNKKKNKRVDLNDMQFMTPVLTREKIGDKISFRFMDTPSKNKNNTELDGIFVEPLSFDDIEDGNDGGHCGDDHYDYDYGFDFDFRDACTTCVDHHAHCFHIGCDFRKAVILVNGLTVAWELLSLIRVEYEFSLLNQLKDMFDQATANGIAGYIDDDNFQMSDLIDAEDPDVLDHLPDWGDVADFVGMAEAIFAVVFFVAMGLNVAGIYGALFYRQWGVITAGTVYLVRLLLALIVLMYIDTDKFHMTAYAVGKVLVICLQLYPHLFLMRQMRQGTMTVSNYHKIETYCACADGTIC